VAILEARKCWRQSETKPAKTTSKTKNSAKRSSGSENNAAMVISCHHHRREAIWRQIISAGNGEEMSAIQRQWLWLKNTYSKK